MTVQGDSIRDIAAATGVTHPAVVQWRQKDEFNQLIKDAQTTLIKDSLLTAVKNQSDKIIAGQNIIKNIVSGEKLNTGAVKLMELAHDSEKQLLQSVGIHPSHTQSIQINNILVDARSELSPAIEAMLVNHLIAEGNQQDSLVIDVEAENIHDATD